MKITTLLLALALLTLPAAAQGTWNATNYGPTCGPLLTVEFDQNGGSTARHFYIRVAKGFADDYAIMIWGTHKVNLPFFGCTLLSDYVWGHSFRTDSKGAALLQRSWPHWAYGTFYVQCAVFNTRAAGPLPVVKLTNGVMLSHTRK